MNATMTSIILGGSVLLEILLELKGIRVPAIVYLLSGFAVRHIIGGDTVKDGSLPQSTVLKANSPIVAQINPIVETSKQSSGEVKS